MQYLCSSRLGSLRSSVVAVHVKGVHVVVAEDKVVCVVVDDLITVTLFDSNDHLKAYYFIHQRQTLPNFPNLALGFN